MLDAGEVATEILYFLVGSRELDGGAMVTASHNPKAYTGVKLVREGALPLSGDAGIGEIREDDREGAARTHRGRRRHDRGGRRLRRVPGTAPWRSIGPGEKVKPMKLVVDGGNGMAGPMIGPLLKRLEMDTVELYLSPTATSPTTSRTRSWRRTES